MSGGQLLDIRPSELKFPFELKKHSSCTLELTNKTDQYVAFKVKTTNPKKYFVRPNMGIVMPNAKNEVSVTMQAQEEAPADMQCKDKFLLQSVVTSFGVTTKDITPDMFDKEAGRVVEEFKLRVIYIPANFPPYVLEGSEMGSSSSMQDNQSAFLFDAVSRSNEEAKLTQASQTFGQLEETSEDILPQYCQVAKVFELASLMRVRLMICITRRVYIQAWLTVSRLTEEKNSAVQQNQMLHQEMELLRKEISRKKSAGFSFMFILLVGVASVLIGYLVKM